MELNKYIDHTLLKPIATNEDIKKLCEEAIKYNFASVCVNPCYVNFAKECLANHNINIAAVVGFPLGANTTEIKTLEAFKAVKDGASEIDMVINNSLFKSKKYNEVLNDINKVCECGVLVKVIVETSNLTSDELIKVCEIVSKSNASFIKTSTGFIGEGAKLEDIKIMKQHCTKKIKASGGIRDKKTMLEMIEAGAERIGTSSGVKIMND